MDIYLQNRLMVASLFDALLPVYLSQFSHNVCVHLKKEHDNERAFLGQLRNDTLE